MSLPYASPEGTARYAARFESKKSHFSCLSLADRDKIPRGHRGIFIFSPVSLPKIFYISPLYL